MIVYGLKGRDHIGDLKYTSLFINRELAVKQARVEVQVFMNNYEYVDNAWSYTEHSNRQIRVQNKCGNFIEVNIVERLVQEF